MASNLELLKPGFSPNSTAGGAAILPVDSWPHLETIGLALSRLRPKLEDDPVAIEWLNDAGESLRYLVEEGEKEAKRAIEWAAAL